MTIREIGQLRLLRLLLYLFRAIATGCHFQCDRLQTRQFSSAGESGTPRSRVLLQLSLDFGFRFYQRIDPEGYAQGRSIALHSNDRDCRLLHFLQMRVPDVLVHRD